MNRTDLKQELAKNYSRKNWLNILQKIFKHVSFLQHPQAIPLSSDILESFEQLGNIRLEDGSNLALFEIRVKDNVAISKNRVQLRNLTAKYIDQTQTHGVLAIFSSNKDDYRFTFTAIETEFDETMQLVSKQTEPKRFTYVLGPNESCRTAAERFFKLSEQKESANLNDVIEAFSVERLNKEFFDKYKEHYEDFVQFITGKRFKKVSGKWKEVEIHEPHPYLESIFENDNKQARDFVKKLLGRLVFIQFLQKKGWMGCPVENSNWTNGDYFFCKRLFESADKDQFHSQYLAQLFDALNSPNRGNDEFEITGSRVPYLNGGLFEADSDAIRQMNFPANHFENLFNFFGEYNFTIDENDPNDHEVGIDPEMLGHIFENLLEDNKDKGAFYTPKPIVQYMCQESLIQYLKTHLVDEENAIENFIRTFDKGDENEPNNYIQQNAQRIEELLDNVKICDPAIGSGAFPMGLLQMIYRAKMTLDWTLVPAEVKRGIIQNSIYGVDIDKGAIEIARLRFWLSLIVDENEPHPLPNLDYKIMQGNSLLESFEGVDLSQIGQGDDMTIVEPEKDLFGNIKEEQLSITQTKSGLKQEIQTLMDRYFSLTDMTEKEKIKTTINDKIHEHIDYNLELRESQLHRFILETGKYANLAPKNKRKVDKWKKELDSLKEKRRNLHALQDEEEKPYFLWHLFFADVFTHGGFDIVIANPPYGVKLDTKTRDQYSLSSKDSYGIFLSHTLKNLLKSNGILSYIISDTWLTIKTHFALRKQVLEKDIINVIRIHQDCFQATVNAAILHMKNSRNEGHNLIAADLTNISTREKTGILTDKFFNLNEYAGTSTPKFAVYEYEQDLIKTNSNLPVFVACPKLFNLMNDTTCQTIEKDGLNVRQIEMNGNMVELVRFGDVAEIKQGLATGDNKYYLYQNPDARGSYKDIKEYKEFLLSDEELEKISNNEDLRLKVINRGLHKSKNEPKFDPDLWFVGKYILPYDKGGESAVDDGWLPKYYVKTDFYIDWSNESVQRMKSLTIADRVRLYSENKKITNSHERTPAAVLRNIDYSFIEGITYSEAGFYAPTFRKNSISLFQNTSNGIFLKELDYRHGLSILNSRAIKYLLKQFIGHTVHNEVEEIKELSLLHLESSSLIQLVKQISTHQKQNPRYDYMSNEQKEIDKLVYEMYGLNEDDIKEVETWYARRYPKLARFAPVD